jgi:hypothetical protein
LEGGGEKTPGRYIGFLEESRANTTHRPAHCGAEAKKKWQVRVARRISPEIYYTR